jgi:thiol-disulfide isomerase/thioredoxin
MRRRDVLAGLGGAAALGGGAYVLGNESTAGGVEPVQVTGIDAPGSREGAVTVPEAGHVTFVEVFATWCDVCAASMEPLATAHERVDDDVQFVSVTSEPLGHAVSRGEVRQWWVDHGGDWQVAADEELTLTERLDATAVPTAVVLDRNNRVTWSATGKHGASTIVDRIAAAGGGDG